MPTTKPTYIIIWKIKICICVVLWKYKQSLEPGPVVYGSITLFPRTELLLTCRKNTHLRKNICFPNLFITKNKIIRGVNMP